MTAVSEAPTNPGLLINLMAFFAGLLISTIAIWMICKLFRLANTAFWDAARLATTIMFVQVGILHLIKPEIFEYMIADIMPFARTIIYITGVAEIVLGMGILHKKYRTISAFLLMILLLVMFPANIYVAIKNIDAPGAFPSNPLYRWSRLIFQPLYILWILKCCGVQFGPVLGQRKISTKV